MMKRGKVCHLGFFGCLTANFETTTNSPITHRNLSHKNQNLTSWNSKPTTSTYKLRKSRQWPTISQIPKTKSNKQIPKLAQRIASSNIKNQNPQIVKQTSQTITKNDTQNPQEKNTQTLPKLDNLGLWVNKVFPE